MDAVDVLRGLGAAAAFGCGLAAVRLIAILSAPSPAMPFGEGDARRFPRVARVLRNGVRPALPIAARALRVRKVADVVAGASRMVEGRGFASPPQALASVLLAAGLAIAVTLGLVSGSAVCAAASTLSAAAILAACVRSADEKRRVRTLEAVPDALRSMASCFRSGLSLQQTMEHIADEAPEPLRSAFSRASHRLQIGAGSTEALAELRRAAEIPELSFVAVALDVQHRTGGSLHQVLDAARDAVEGELELRRSLRVHTAQAKLSARVVTVLPFALVAVFSLVSSDFLAPFLSSATGVALLAAALGMQAAGVVCVRRMLAVEVA